MQNIILSYPNRADTATFLDGSWLSELPASNLANREIWRVARSTDAELSSTKFTADLGTERLLRCFALANHNMSADARWRVTVGLTAGASDIYDSGWVDVWQMVFDNLLEWEAVTWWTGTAGDEYYRSPYPALLAMPDFVTGRYITVEIDDTANPDGYVQIGRLFAGGGIQPATNAAYGLEDGWRELSTKDASESGSPWATKRRRLRWTSFVIDHFTHAEAAYIHEMQRLLGTVEEVLYLPYPEDMGESQRYGFIGTLSELSAIEYPYYNSRSSAFKIEEIG